VGSEREEKVLDDVRRLFIQIALELEASAAGAKAAAIALPDREAAWPQVQQMYTRFQEAAFLVERIQKVVDEAMAAPGPA
jgi:hypothetical protein